MVLPDLRYYPERGIAQDESKPIWRRLYGSTRILCAWLANQLRRSNLPLPIIVASITTLLVLCVGGWMTTVGPWYQNLRKPWWNPPNWIFGPAWTVILGLAAWSGVLAWTHAPGSSGQFLILILFVINIVLHMLWSPLFFNLKRPDWALIEVPFLWLSIVAIMFEVGRFSTLAVWLLLPYLLWVSFAAFLNYTIVRLNAPFGAAT